MKDKAQICFQAHRASFDFWSYGDIDRIWNDENGVLCIQYSSGNCKKYVMKNCLKQSNSPSIVALFLKKFG